MTPQERKLIEDLFDRLASLENAPRDAEAIRAINSGLQRAPNALYPLVQTALVQDEALKRADARIRELEDELGIQPGQPAQQGSFLDSMRDAVFGKTESRGSVPSVRGDAGRGVSSPWGSNAQQGGYAAPPTPAPAPMSSGGSFLGTAAASAAGVVGGALLMNSMRGLFGGQGTAHGAFDPGIGSGTPWGPSSGDGGLARDAGIDSIGRGGGHASSEDSQRAGLFDAPSDNGDVDDSSLDDGGFDVGGDVGGDGGSDSA
jgi:hypothetical protein